jgi:hypothetical protein
MRAIKFRAWVPEEYKTFTGWGLFYEVERPYDTLGDMGDGNGGRREYDWQSFYDVLSKADEGKLVLMQYTGLSDKNGQRKIRRRHCQRRSQQTHGRREIQPRNVRNHLQRKNIKLEVIFLRKNGQG